MAKSYKSVCIEWTDQLLRVIDNMITKQTDPQDTSIVYYTREQRESIESVARRMTPDDEFSVGFLTACGLIMNYVVSNDPIVGSPNLKDVSDTVISIEKFLRRNQ